MVWESIKDLDKIGNEHRVSCFNEEEDGGLPGKPRQSGEWSTCRSLESYPT